MVKKFLPNLYVCGADEINDVSMLYDLGINAIMNVAWEIEDPIYPPGEFLQIKVGCSDDHDNPAWVKSLALLTLQSLLDNGKTVMLHCAAGASRSVYFAVRYISEKEHRSIDAVYKEFMETFPRGEVLISPLNYAV